MQCYEKGNIRQVAAKYDNTLLYSASQLGTMPSVVVGVFSFFKNSQSIVEVFCLLGEPSVLSTIFWVFLIKHQISNYTILR